MRYPRKIIFGGGLYLLVRPEGGRYRHYQYRYGEKRKTLSLGIRPDVLTALAQARQDAAGIDPSMRSRELRAISGEDCVAATELTGTWRQVG